jgi:predicted MPP superfamily phosphohydrolase
LVAANAFVCWTWSYFSGAPGWRVWQIIPDLLAIAFIACSVIGFRYSNAPLRAIHRVAAWWLGALNFAVFAAIGCWIMAGVDWLAGWPVQRIYIARFFFAVSLFATIYGLINAAWIRVTRITVHLPHVPEAWHGRTAALVTDTHLGPIAGPRFLRRVLTKLKSVQPDVVLISGDLFDGSPVGLKRLAAPWREFSAPWGVFFVTGNHEEFSDREVFLNAVRDSGIHILNNEKVGIHGLQVVGVLDSEAANPPTLRAILRQAHLDPQQPSVLLSHQPSNLSVPEEEGVSLQLSGHTHGGQMWPWNLVAARVHGRFVYGLNRLGNLQVYTSSGAGTWGPPLRVRTRAEIVLIQFEQNT